MQIEGSESVIEFPGGYISVARTSTGEYWAHIQVVNAIPGSDHYMTSRTGKIIDQIVCEDKLSALITTVEE